MLGLVANAETIVSESGSTALCFAMHCVGTAVFAAKATEYQKERYLEPIARGEHITTLVLSEPGTGLHFYIPQTRLTRSGRRGRYGREPDQRGHEAVRRLCVP